mgnify:CR=1 FL=1
MRFNTQPPKGGWHARRLVNHDKLIVSTHSRLKAAGEHSGLDGLGYSVSTHSRLKAAGMLDIAEVLTRQFQHTAA